MLLPGQYLSISGMSVLSSSQRPVLQLAGPGLAWASGRRSPIAGTRCIPALPMARSSPRTSPILDPHSADMLGCSCRAFHLLQSPWALPGSQEAPWQSPCAQRPSSSHKENRSSKSSQPRMGHTIPAWCHQFGMQRPAIETLLCTLGYDRSRNESSSFGKQLPSCKHAGPWHHSLGCSFLSQDQLGKASEDTGACPAPTWGLSSLSLLFLPRPPFSLPSS